LATVNNLSTELYEPLSKIENVKCIEGATYDLLSHATAAVVTSGTATLETALFKVPQVVVYKTSSISYFIGKRLIKVPFISLVNLIAQRKVVNELIQEEASVDTVIAELNQLVVNGEYRSSVLAGYEEIIKILDTGSASQNTAKLMMKYLQTA
jgi:lipid-A-disaccharide synthase